MTLRARFDNSYAALPARFFTRMDPVPVAAPELLAFNAPLAEALGLAAPDRLEAARVFAGNAVPDGAAPLAQVYAGHQFGGFSPQLGDGRAILLGEVLGPDGRRHDLQLKGSGPTPYSRMGDGRAWLGPVLREYLVSEAMAALGVPTTRALAAVATGETVLRERPLPGAVLTRVAASHIRVGTFQYFAARRDVEALAALEAHARGRHYPDAGGPEDLLAAVIAAQAELVARWMALGFIHGVMNTDNCAISGETIDYGPCAFMDAYDPATVFSSIDRGGRYAYANQPRIALWNLAQFATALLPLMPDEAAAIERFTEMLDGFAARYEAARRARFGAKIGLADAGPGDDALIEDLLGLMEAAGTDFTNGFRALGTEAAAAAFPGHESGFEAWSARWRARLAGEAGVEARMRAANPAYIPRNHRVEAMIAAALEGDMAPFERLQRVLSRPYEEQPGAEDLAAPPLPHEAVQATFCGT